MKIGIVAGGPREEIPSLLSYQEEIDYWIGADSGAVVLLEQGVPIDLALGDFDSVSAKEYEEIKRSSHSILEYPSEKDETDLELALNEGLKLNPKKIYLFGVTAGRIDHELINMQQLYLLRLKQVEAVIIDAHHEISLYKPGEHIVKANNEYPYVSFIPFSPTVENLSLQGFYYKLTKATVQWGSTLCISNQIIEDSASFSFTDGIILLIKSRDK